MKKEKSQPRTKDNFDRTLRDYYNNERKEDAITSGMHVLNKKFLDKLGDTDMLCVDRKYLIIKDHQSNPHFDLTRLKKEHPDVFMSCSKPYYKKGIVVTKINKVGDNNTPDIESKGTSSVKITTDRKHAKSTDKEQVEGNNTNGQ